MKITYRHNDSDLFLFAIHSLRVNPVSVIILLVFSSAIALTTLAESNYSSAGRFAALFLRLGLFATIVLGLQWLQLIPYRNRVGKLERTFTLEEDRFVMENAFSRTEARWPSVKKIARTPRHITISFWNSFGEIIPKRAFSSSADWDVFWETLSRGYRTSRSTLP